MFFNSIEFAIFLPIVFMLYWIVPYKKTVWKNSIVVASSYFFYGWWDPLFLFLIAFSSILDFSIASKMNSSSNKGKKLLLYTSIVSNLGLLLFFKYSNFFIDNFVDAFSFFGKPIQIESLNIILPVGISFYTFQTLSYTIDVYKGKLKASNNIISFFAFVSFFPQLVAGPIERATNLLPQFSQPRKFNSKNAIDGLKQILYGLFQKVVIADTCAGYATEIFNNYNDFAGLTLLMGALFFTFQIYGDFSGYSNIAIGTAKLLDIKLMKNFSTPYFSRDIAEFWRRWHISLSTWFRDYVYIPLGGSKGNLFKKIRNTFIIFTISGFWHGANWTYIVWGLLNAIYFLPYLITNTNKKNIQIVASNKHFPSLKELLSICSTFFLILISWVVFRSENLTQAYHYIPNIFRNVRSYFQIENYLEFIEPLFLIFVFLLIEWNGRRNEHALSSVGKNKPTLFKWILFLILATTILLYSGSKQEFIYFQF